MHQFENGSASGFGRPDLTQQLGRAQRHPSGRPAGTRDLPGLIRKPASASRPVRGSPPGRAGRASSGRSLSPTRIPVPRSTLDGRLEPGRRNGVDHGLANGQGRLPAAPDGLGAALATGSATGPAKGSSTRGRPAGASYREVADGMAIEPKITVVLPVMNEAANLPGVFASLPKWVDEVVLVDGRSSDGSVDVARRLRPDIKVVLQGGAGKGDALAAGFEAATGDIIVAIDGDGSTDGHEIVRFVSALLAGADFAKGSRFSSSGASDDITVLRRCGNKALNVTVNRLFGTSFSDLCYGYNAFWSRHLGKLEIDAPGFEVETLLSIRAAQAGLSIHEVPSHERLRQNGTSNLSAMKDGWRVLRLIAQEKRDARRRKAGRPKPFMAPGRLVDDADLPPVRNEQASRSELLRGIPVQPGRDSSSEAGR
jgi:hypothetical protein